VFNEKREMNIIQILNNILNENHCDFISKLLLLKSQSTWFFLEYSAFISLFLKFSLFVKFKILLIRFKKS